MVVTKKNRLVEEFNEVKILAKIVDLSEGLTVSPEEVYAKTNIHYYDGMKTTELNTLAAETAHNLATVNNTHYDTLAARLYSDNLPTVEEGLAEMRYSDYVKRWLETNLHHDEVLTYLAYKHDRSYIGIRQIHTSYMQGDENENLMFLGTAIEGFNGLGMSISDTIDFAYLLLKGDVTKPSPMIRDVRFGRTNVASCCTIRTGDSILSWNESLSAIISHTVSNAGIGWHIADVASIGEKVRKGKVTHAGKIPLIKLGEAAINSSKQEGRRGAMADFISMLDPEIEEILRLKSPKTEIMKRVNDVKYGILLRLKLIAYLIEHKHPLKLFSARQEPELHEAQYLAGDVFETMYIEKYLNGDLDKYPEIEPLALLTIFHTERFENGVYYPIMIDNVNDNKIFTEPIVQANLCVEYLAPTKPLDPNNRDSPDIGVCVLSNFNQAALDTLEKLERAAKLLVYSVNNLMRKQVHPTPQANAYIRDYGTIGFGFSNHAYWVAKNGFKFGDTGALELHKQWMEWYEYSLVKASMEYAKTYKVVPTLFRTKDIRGLYGIWETVKHKASPEMEERWRELDKQVKIHGMANCSLSMTPPSESSSIGSNQTNNLLPLKDMTTVKDNGGIRTVQYPPDIANLKGIYDYANWDKDITNKYLKHVALTQEWTDMGISADTFYNPELYPNGKVPIQQMIEDLFTAHKNGVKAFYYNNVPVGQDNDSGCAGGGCEV